MYNIIKLKDLHLQAKVDFDNQESLVRGHLTSLNQLTQLFTQASSEQDIILPLLQAAVQYSQAIAGSYVPSDDGCPLAVIREDQELDTIEVDSWGEYFSASSIRSQCKICRKIHPENEICPLMSNPFSGEVDIFCYHLKTGKHKFGVVNLYLEKNNAVDEDIQAYLTTITNTATLAISHLRGMLFLQNEIAKLDHEEFNSFMESKSISEIQRNAIRSERTRLAREIHDGLAQILGYVKLQLSQSIDKLESGETRDVYRLMHSSYQAISDAYIDAREAIDDLHNIPYSEDFFVWLLETTKEYGKNFKIETKVTGWPGELKFPPNIHIHLTRMLQEILSNIRKHAKAEMVELIYKRDEDYTLLEIRDNGIGIPNNITPDRSRHGLKSLQERADLINADLNIAGIKGEGTIVQIRLTNNEIRWSS